MRNLVCALFALCFLTSSQIVYANKPVVAVFEIPNTAGLTKLEVSQLTDFVAAQLAASGLFKVAPNSDLKKAISGKKSESYESC